MLFSIDHFTAPNDIVLRYGIAGPQNPRAHVLILQGRGEFIERYDETAHELAERGLGCITLDFAVRADRLVKPRNPRWAMSQTWNIIVRMCIM